MPDIDIFFDFPLTWNARFLIITRLKSTSLMMCINRELKSGARQKKPNSLEAGAMENESQKYPEMISREAMFFLSAPPFFIISYAVWWTKEDLSLPVT